MEKIWFLLILSTHKKISGGLKNHMWQHKTSKTMHLYITNAISLAQPTHRLLCSKNYRKNYKTGSCPRTVVFKLSDNPQKCILIKTHTSRYIKNMFQKIPCYISYILVFCPSFSPLHALNSGYSPPKRFQEPLTGHNP